ncbi:peptidoglycan editing factor PgeF [bacterium]|nr:MAG: peptidoglycan editing factor PgeF [bacterium]
MVEVEKPKFSGAKVKAFFTLKNEHFAEDRLIPGLNVGFNTSENREQIIKNRKQIFDSYYIDDSNVAFGNQVHGTHIELVEQPGLYANTDGLLTCEKGIGLAILVADCAAILLYDEESNSVSALHAGWRGAIGGILLKALDMFKAKGSSLKKIQAFVSPCISAAQFEVGEEVAAQFPEEVVIRGIYEKPHIDLKLFLKNQFLEAGVNMENVEIHDGCTLSEASNYYSYRREGKQSGRMMAYIELL